MGVNLLTLSSHKTDLCTHYLKIMKILSTKEEGKFTVDKEGKRLIALIQDLWWGKDRWDSSTESVMNEIADLLQMGKEDEE